ncbi:flagellar hook-associated protein 3 [Stutzerimonas xanthomarina]|uniref:flagellar hook-associated protein 3 n=1 Tax=Stutzerimonas xanthomarina TaxID=271420 RepID=UPI003AA7F198
MRISTLQAFNNGVAGIQRNYSNATRTQEQISTGNRILTPADDPVASVRLLQLEQQQNVLSQYNSNLTAAKNSLTQEEVTLNSVNTVLQRVRELAVQAGNGALDPQDRKSIAAELGEREDELLSLMNTRNARGEYLFSGFQGKTQPFARGADGSYSYQGDEGQRKLQIASSLNIPISDNGKSIFENVINAGRLASAVITNQPGSTLSVSAALVQDEVAFSGNPSFPKGGIGIHFTSATDYVVYDLAAPPTAFPVVDGESDLLLASGTLNDNQDKSDTLTFRGVHLQFDGVPVGGESIVVAPSVFAASVFTDPPELASATSTSITDSGAFAKAFPSGKVSYTIIKGSSTDDRILTLSTDPALNFTFTSGAGLSATDSQALKDLGLSINMTGATPVGNVSLTRVEEQKQGVLDTIANLRSALESPANGNIGVRDAVAVALTNLDHGMVSVDQARGNIGARLNVIETTQTDNEDVALVNKGVQAELRELDYAEALSRLSMQTVVLEAAQQSYVKIAGLSLFNAMR